VLREYRVKVRLSRLSAFSLNAVLRFYVYHSTTEHFYRSDQHIHREHSFDRQTKLDRRFPVLRAVARFVAGTTVSAHLLVQSGEQGSRAPLERGCSLPLSRLVPRFFLLHSYRQLTLRLCSAATRRQSVQQSHV
jgi:hypothetical protein